VVLPPLVFPGIIHIESAWVAQLYYIMGLLDLQSTYNNIILCVIKFTINDAVMGSHFVVLPLTLMLTTRPKI